MDNLIFINQLGSDYKGNYMYEFIFGDEKNCDGAMNEERTRH
jgi:hypothetical protein